MLVVLKDRQAVPDQARGTVTALGNFDGVHRGHAYLLHQLRKQCPERPLSVVTFEPHPRQLFSLDKAPFRLTRAEERNAILHELGVDYIFQINFDQNFSKVTAHDFVHEILHHSLGVTHVACGQGFVFGHQRQGDTDYLTSETGRLGMKTVLVNPLTDGSGIISSSRIRHLLKEGQPEQAAELLGRVWSIRNHVQHGDKRGRLLGFPTANLALGEQLEPKCGVYAIKVTLPDQAVYMGVANVGYRPTIGDQKECRLEAHLFDFDQDIYGQEITVSLYHFIRSEKRFDGLAELQAQITKDAIDAKNFFNR